MGRKKFKAGEGQRAFALDRFYIPSEYDEILARRAAMRRFHRIGALALDKKDKQVTAGFRSSTRGLWIPYSRGEFKSVVKVPEVQMHNEQMYAREQVRKKYEDTNVSRSRVERWANFAAQNRRNTRHQKFRDYHFEAGQDLGHLTSAVDEDRTYTLDNIDKSPYAFTCLKEFVIALKSFKEQKWIYKHWVNKRAQALESANVFLRSLSDKDLVDIYDEAIWSSWSRMRYWYPKTLPPKPWSNRIFDPTLESHLIGPFELAEPPPEYEEVEAYP